MFVFWFGRFHSICTNVLFVCESGVLETGHGGVDEGEVVEHGLVHAVDDYTVCDGKSRLLVYELLIEVTTVIC